MAEVRQKRSSIYITQVSFQRDLSDQRHVCRSSGSGSPPKETWLLAIALTPGAFHASGLEEALFDADLFEGVLLEECLVGVTEPAAFVPPAF